MLGSVKRKVKSTAAAGTDPAQAIAAALDADTIVASPRRRGRGAVSNRSGRFEEEARESIDDGWGGSEYGAPSRST